MSRVGLLGGTFDPVHGGHIQLAHAARKELGLDQVLLIPAAEPPHKEGDAVSSFRHRQRMLLLALQGQEGLSCSTIEAELPRPSYTIDTLRQLISMDDPPREYFFIIGVDAFAELLTWKQYQNLLRTVHLAVAMRRGFNDWPQLERIAERFGYRRQSRRWTGGAEYKDITFLQEIPFRVSSTEIRAVCRDGGLPEGLHPDVLDYIRYHRLYQVIEEKTHEQ